MVFNAKQTEELLSKGFTNTRGTAHLLGTAYNNGIILPTASNNYKYTGTSSTTSSTSSSSSTTKSTSEKAADDFIDFIKIFLSRVKTVTDRLIDAIDDAVSLSEKMSANSKALSQVQKEITANQNAKNKYQSLANGVALSESYKKKIRDGSLSIENITDEDLKDKIDKYKEYYENVLSCQDAILDLQRQEKEIAQERLDYIKSYYDAVAQVNESFIEMNDTKLELKNSLGQSAVSDDVKKILYSSIEKQQESYNQALQQLSDYQSEFNNLVRNGYIEKGSEAYYEGQAQIIEFTQQVDEAAIALVELEDKIREIDYIKLQQVIDSADRKTDQLKNSQSLAEARDEVVGRDELQKQIDSLHNSVETNYALRDKKLQEQNKYDVGSDRYNELAEEIAEIDSDIYSNLEDIESLKDQIFENEFINYEKEQDNLEYFIGELDDFSELLNEDAYLDKDGKFTDEAYAKIALVSEQINASKQQIANANEALKKLDEMYTNGLISQEEYEEKQKELLDTVRDSSIAVNDYKEELLDLYKAQIEQENEALKENIELRQEALNNQREYWEYADKVKSQTKDVDALNAQIAALQGVNNASAQAELKRLIAERDEAQKSLDDTKRDHQYDMMSQGYEEMADSLDKSLEDIEYSLSHSSEKQLEIVQSMLDQMVASYKNAYGKINDIVNESGYSGSSNFQESTEKISTSEGTQSVANSAMQSQSSVNPSESVTNINSSNTSNSNHESIESEIKKEPNTTERLCAELTLNRTYASIQEGDTIKLTVSIKPNDAKNKEIAWSSSNSNIASVSDGQVTALKAGNVTIKAFTTDGSGLSKSCTIDVSKKPTPPKTTNKTNVDTGKSQGNGVADIGDKVTYDNGVYHQESNGSGKWGNQNLGESVYITNVNPGSAYPIHISKGNKLHSNDRGWVKLSQIKGYWRGTKAVEKNGLFVIDDTSDGNLDLGSEAVITNRGVLTQMNAGDTVFNKEQVKTLWEMSKGSNPYNNIHASTLLKNLPEIVSKNEVKQDTSVNNYIDSLVNIEGNLTKDLLPNLMRELKKVIPELSREMAIYERGENKKY